MRTRLFSLAFDFSSGLMKSSSGMFATGSSAAGFPAAGLLASGGAVARHRAEMRTVAGRQLDRKQRVNCIGAERVTRENSGAGEARGYGSSPCGERALMWSAFDLATVARAEPPRPPGTRAEVV